MYLRRLSEVPDSMDLPAFLGKQAQLTSEQKKDDSVHFTPVSAAVTIPVREDTYIIRIPAIHSTSRDIPRRNTEEKDIG